MATMTTLEQRVMIQDLAQAGYSDPAIAEEMGWGLSTIRKWRRRAQTTSNDGLASYVGRPKAGALTTLPADIQGALKALRKAHPGWGPKTLLTQMARDPAMEGRDLPGRSSVARWLNEQQLARPYERHQDLPQPKETDAHEPHQVWEMDARGCDKVPGIGTVSLINLNDRFSKVKLLSYPALLGEHRASRHPDTEEYQMVLRLAFTDWGLADRLCVDRESIFFDNTSRSPFPTHLHLWLVGLGVTFEIGPPHRPTVRAMTERSHQTWAWQALSGQSFTSWQGLWEYLLERRDFLNEWFPSEASGGLPPLVAHPEARKPRRLYRPEWEHDLLDISRIHAYLSRGRWFRKASNVGAVSLGQQTYLLGRTWAHEEVVAHFDATDQHMVFHAPKAHKEMRLPVKGIDPSLMVGQRGPFARMDGFQLSLPFTWAEWQLSRQFTSHQVHQSLEDT